MDQEDAEAKVYTFYPTSRHKSYFDRPRTEQPRRRSHDTHYQGVVRGRTRWGKRGRPGRKRLRIRSRNKLRLLHESILPKSSV